MNNYGKGGGKKSQGSKPKPKSTMSATADMMKKGTMVGKKK